MSMECFEDSRKAKRYEECIHLANQYGKFFLREIGKVRINGQSCPRERIKVNGSPLLASVMLADIRYPHPPASKVNQIKICWRSEKPGLNGEVQEQFYYGGRNKDGYGFVIKTLGDKRPRLPTEDEVVLVDQIVYELGKTYRLRYVWWRKLLAKFTHHNGKENY